MGFFSWVGQQLKKHNENVEKEKEHLERASDSMLAQMARGSPLSVRGMAAMKLLQERGYSGEDVARL